MPEQEMNIENLQKIVEETMKEQELIMDNLIHPPHEEMTTGQRISDKVARFGGSWAFIISFMIILIVWIIFNSFAPQRFDPYPFILMNLVLSCIAALQAPIIMMSQNRQEEKDRRRAENDYLINLKAELEVRSLNRKIDLLLQQQIKELFEVQQRQLELLDAITKRLEKREM